MGIKVGRLAAAVVNIKLAESFAGTLHAMTFNNDRFRPVNPPNHRIKFFTKFPAMWYQEPMSRPRGSEGASKYAYRVMLIMHSKACMDDHKWYNR